ncbi:chromate efflux transporter [Glutamicibacter sp. AOP38-B1-38]|uniref:chromate efflux transporter n=1 Tax=Glutamicibacter sp. AOP38-B1-38 TaxID=3457680 RepID=UPI0040333350
MTSSPSAAPAGPPPAAPVREVFAAFLKLGLTSFGGPTAHLGFFREEFVVKRKWLSESAYADLVALCQFLPGPASSQVGMALGLQRSGTWGLLAAWAAFTLPSAILLVLFALAANSLDSLIGDGWITGLKAATVAVVAHAVLGMAKTLAPDAPRATLAVAAMGVVLLFPSPFIQVAVILAAGLLGLLWMRNGAEDSQHSDFSFARHSRRSAVICLAVFALLLIGLPVAAAVFDHPALQLTEIFYSTGALVFGGGHVVLPMLETQTVGAGFVEHDAFLAGYAAAQAVPGPLFTFAAYLGMVFQSGPSGVLGAGIALLAIFLPSALLVAGALPFWQRLRSSRTARRALSGINAAVVGLLAAALYSPVFLQGASTVPTLVLAAAGFLALHSWRIPPWMLVISSAVIGWALL